MVCHYVCEKNIERNFMMIRREPGSESRFASETSNYRIRYYCTPKTVIVADVNIEIVIQV